MDRWTETAKATPNSVRCAPSPSFGPSVLRSFGPSVLRSFGPSVLLSHQLLHLRRLALLGVARIRVAAVDALLAEAGALPDQVVDGALQLGDPVFEVLNGGAGARWHGLAPRWSWRLRGVGADGGKLLRGRPLATRVQRLEL